ASARLWDDGIIDPVDTRRGVAWGIEAARNAPVEPQGFSLFRMYAQISGFEIVTGSLGGLILAHLPLRSTTVTSVTLPIARGIQRLCPLRYGGILSVQMRRSSAASRMPASASYGSLAMRCWLR